MAACRLGVRRLARLALAGAALWLIACSPASAGSACTDQALTAPGLRNALELAYRTRAVVERAGAGVALVARVGADLSEYGLRYSHAGALVHDHPKGEWIFVHVLNECGTPTSEVYNEGLANFYLDDPFDYEALVVVPSRALQARLSELLRGPLARALHTPRYNMLAYPWSETYQNSNQWLAEVLAAAHAAPGAVETRVQAQRRLRELGFAGDPIRIPALKRLGIRLARANVQLGEHERLGFYGTYETVTVRALVRLLDRIDTPLSRAVIRLDRPEALPTGY